MSIEEALREMVRMELSAQMPEIEARVEARLRGKADGERYVTTEEAAQIVGKSVASLETWRSRGGGPPFIRTGARKGIKYKVCDLHEWMGIRKRRNNQDLGRAHG